MDGFDFPKKHLLILLGPVQLALLCSDLQEMNDPGLFTIWVSVGVLNVLLLADLHPQSLAALEKISQWTSTRNIVLEYWEIECGQILNSKTVFPSQEMKGLPDSLRSLVNVQGPSVLRSALQEYCALMSSALSRAQSLIPYIYSELLQINEAVEKEVGSYLSDSAMYIEVYLRLLNINAALSRFTSQAFSGTPPILHTECHYWIHSLLGTGTANIAISKLSQHLTKVLGDAHIPERLAAMELRTDKVPTLDQLNSDLDFVTVDHLISQKHVDASDPYIPLITYFSGRDGFSSHIYTLSAPLTTITECNSYRSSLLTITHELAHIQIRGVLSSVYPNLDDEADIALAIKMLTPQFKATNWLDAAKQLLLEGIISMEHEDRSLARLEEMELKDPAALRRILRQWRREVQEILVHTFDFLYFYSAKPDIYISSIWHSWCAIPGIADRVPEYVMRVLCATGSSFLRLPHAGRLEAIKGQVLNQLNLLQKEGGLLSNYVELAITHLEENWKPSNGKIGICNQLRAGLVLTRFVKTFLYSETFAAKIYSEPFIASSGVKESGYAKRKNEFDLVPIGNPLRFLSENIKDSPTETDSLWVLQNLAFNSTSGLSQ
nr:hypothetical protein [Candidatus Saccharibacteria bacterium]